MEPLRKMIGSAVAILAAILALAAQDASAVAINQRSGASTATVDDGGALDLRLYSGAISSTGLADTNFAYRPTQVYWAAFGGASSGSVIPPLDPFSRPEAMTIDQNGPAVVSPYGTISPVPEPGTILLLATGLIGVALWGRRRALQ